VDQLPGAGGKVRIFAEGRRTDGDEIRFRDGIAGGEQVNVMAAFRKSVRQIGANLLPRAVSARRRPPGDGGQNADSHERHLVLPSLFALTERRQVGFSATPPSAWGGKRLRMPSCAFYHYITSFSHGE